MNMPIQEPSRDGLERLWVAAVVCVLSLPLAAASSAAQASSPSSWKFVSGPYGWMAGVSGQVGVGNLTTDVNAGFRDIRDHLDFGGMTSFDARKGRYLIDGDIMYVSLSGEKAFAIRGASGELMLDQREAIVQGAVGYTLTDTPIWTVDLMAGTRYWNLRSEIGVDPANRTALVRSGRIDWFDAIGGARVRYNPTRLVHIVVDGDAGGGGARNTWRALGTTTYDVTSRYGVTAGYKYLAVDYDHDGVLFDTHTAGWLLGLTVSW